MQRVVDYNAIEDYCDGTTLYTASEYCGTVQVSAEADLTPIAAIGYYKPGAMAHTSGWGSSWQLGIDSSTWTPMGAFS